MATAIDALCASASFAAPAAGFVPAPPPLDIVVVGRRMPLADVVMAPRSCLCIRTVVQGGGGGGGGDQQWS